MATYSTRVTDEKFVAMYNWCTQHIGKELSQHNGRWYVVDWNENIRCMWAWGREGTGGPLVLHFREQSDLMWFKLAWAEQCIGEVYVWDE